MRGEGEMMRSRSHQWENTFREFRAGLNEDQYDEFEDACSEYGSFIMSAKIDEDSEQPVIVVSLDELIKKKDSLDDEFLSVPFEDYEAYEDSFEWDFDEDSKEWKFIADTVKLREYTEQAIKNFFASLKSDVEYAFWRVGLWNILVLQRIVEKEGVYHYSDNVERVSKQLDEVLSSDKKLEVQFIQNDQWFDVDDVMIDLKDYLEDVSHPDRDRDIW